MTVARLAERKKLPAEALHKFGLSDTDDGVLFTYVAPDGTPGRTRLRTGMSGAAGWSWVKGDANPVVAYSTPEGLELARSAGYQIVVEGESDCWTAWYHGFPAVGIPGSENWDALSRDHLPVSEVFVQVEAEHPRTYPDGVASYVAAVTRHIRGLGFTGPVHELHLGDGFRDMSDFYRSDLDGYTAALGSILDRARLGS
ncbi:hypothetical protein [Streptomyces sp. GbtcB6]|uniref:hypothetical protein n=1 Tax=Streptomyces sp. GbtcB6 TaxID=2824751 RepID=UPI001C30EB62|nr:hypothetical protein [Streptomyces sp. GbtcB6]